MVLLLLLALPLRNTRVSQGLPSLGSTSLTTPVVATTFIDLMTCHSTAPSSLPFRNLAPTLL